MMYHVLSKSVRLARYFAPVALALFDSKLALVFRATMLVGVAAIGGPRRTQAECPLRLRPGLRENC